MYLLFLLGVKNKHQICWHGPKVKDLKMTQKNRNMYVERNLVDFYQKNIFPRSAAELVTFPMQLVATQVYVPRQHVPSAPDIRRWISPALSSTPSLYQDRTG